MAKKHYESVDDFMKTTAMSLRMTVDETTLNVEKAIAVLDSLQRLRCLEDGHQPVIVYVDNAFKGYECYSCSSPIDRRGGLLTCLETSDLTLWG